MKDTGILYSRLNSPISRREVVIKYCTGKDVLDLGCVNHTIENTDADSWLHGVIRGVARRLVGIDYLQEAVDALNRKGFTVVQADVTRPIPIAEKFDVIVVGNLIEHLSNFEGFWKNLESLLRPNGCVLISTPNPFYIEQYFYTAFREELVVNSEHTCWIDPLTLEQLANRFGFKSDEVFWIKERWYLHQVICHGKDDVFDIPSGLWKHLERDRSAVEVCVSSLASIFVRVFARARYNQALCRLSKTQIDMVIYRRIKEQAFRCWWAAYRRLIKTSRLNKYEQYMSVLTRAQTA